MSDGTSTALQNYGLTRKAANNMPVTALFGNLPKELRQNILSPTQTGSKLGAFHYKPPPFDDPNIVLEWLQGPALAKKVQGIMQEFYDQKRLKRANPTMLWDRTRLDWERPFVFGKHETYAADAPVQIIPLEEYDKNDPRFDVQTTALSMNQEIKSALDDYLPWFPRRQRRSVRVTITLASGRPVSGYVFGKKMNLRNFETGQPVSATHGWIPAAMVTNEGYLHRFDRWLDDHYYKTLVPAGQRFYDLVMGTRD